MLVVFLSVFWFFFFTLSGILSQEMMLLLSFLIEPFTLEPVSSGHLVIPLWVGGRVSQGKTRENQKPSRD